MSLRLDWCSYEAARYAVTHWHYSGRMPAAKLARVGVWQEDEFIGAVIYGCGVKNALVRQYGLEPWEGCELVRVALTKHRDTVSKIVAISLKLLRRGFPRLRLVVSFADPVQGHHGGIYQALGWIYSGETQSQTHPVIDGVVRHARTLGEMIRAGTVAKRSDVVHVDIPPKHRYLKALDDEMSERIRKLAKKYPTRPASVKVARPTFQLGGAGAVPSAGLK